MLHLRAVLLALAMLAAPSAIAFAEDPAATGNGEHWLAYGYNITAPASIWPMLELLLREHFDWELASAGRRPTPIVWANLPPGVYGQYSPALNIVKVALVLQNASVELGAAFLAHELTHLTDDLNGKLGDMVGNVCYEAEVRAFVNEANFMAVTLATWLS